MTAVFLQARLDSSRLPRKALAELGGRTVLERCFDALQSVNADLRVLVTEPASAEDLRPLAARSGWTTFVGQKDDVLDRFVLAAREYSVTTVIRATGDNPLVSADLANLLLERHRNRRSDYSGFQGAPIGSGVEILNVAALEQAWNSQPDDYEREHVSPFLYRRPDRFLVDRPQVEPRFEAASARITLDTAEDLSYIQWLWKENYQGSPLEVEVLIPWLKRHQR